MSTEGMQRDTQRLLKIDKALSVKIHGKDQHGDTIFVDIEGPRAQQILDYLHRGLTLAPNGNFLEKQK